LEALQLTLVQMGSIDSLEQNIQSIDNFLKTQEKESTQLICFPENCLYLRVQEGQPIQGVSLTHDCWARWISFSKKFDQCLHLGSVPVKSGDKLTNASVVITPEDGLRVAYEKVHLFDIDLEGQKPIRESDVFAAGKNPEILIWRNWKIGLSICYDLRFAELYSFYARQAVDLVLVPSSFLVPTGRAHWHVLLRARAIESQCYVAAAAQSGSHVSVHDKTIERQTYGHSLVVDPWGVVLTDLGERAEDQVLQSGIQILTKAKINQVRRQIPMSLHRKL
jgi:deaminated glutathione amidase